MFSTSHYNKSVKYILPPDFTRWRPTPANPYIYISFSSDYLAESYCAGSVEDLKIGLIEFNAEVREEIKIIIQESWGKQVPIRYLDQHVTTEELQNKNIIFVVGQSSSYKEREQKYGYSSMTTHSNLKSHPSSNNDLYYCKIIYL